MDLRDELAIHRTVLANQRTLLTFFNASLALVITGLTLIKFFSGHFIYWFGWALLPAGVLLLGCGFKNFFAHQRKIKDAYRINPTGSGGEG